MLKCNIIRKVIVLPQCSYLTKVHLPNVAYSSKLCKHTIVGLYINGLQFHHIVIIDGRKLKVRKGASLQQCYIYIKFYENPLISSSGKEGRYTERYQHHNKPSVTCEIRDTSLRLHIFVGK
jgi:hypothetical protein